MSRVLFRGGVVHGQPGASAVAIEDGRIAWIGSDDASGGYVQGDEVIELHGALLAPAFSDGHMHTVLTGFQLTRLDLRRSNTVAEALDLVAEQAAVQPDGVIIGTGWEEHAWAEGRPPTAAELDRAAPGRLVMLERRDCHSCVVSPALAAAIEGAQALPGWTPDGLWELEARSAVTDALAELIGPDQRLVAARAATAAMAAAGIAGFHEAAAPHIGPAYEIDLVRHAAQLNGLLPTIYWGSRSFDEARELGANGLAGDLNADGAIGSRTAALLSDYADQPGNCGHAHLDAETIADHLISTGRAGLQGGFHCIGEAALETVADGLRLAEKQVGAETMRGWRHRLEHVEMPSDRLLQAMADLGVVASMQPLFDDLWGGPDRMYAERVGERWRGMNPVGRMSRAGVAMTFGSDSPVTPIAPWLGVLAAVEHRDPDERIDAATAFAAHTVGGWHAARVDDAGRIATGQAAHLAVWDCPAGIEADLPVLDRDLLPSLRVLYVDGQRAGEEPQ